MVLKEDSSKSPDEFELSGVKPTVFTIGNEKGTLLVYTFKSFVDRKDKVEKSNKFNDSYYSFNAKNTLLVYVSAQGTLN